MCLLVICAPEFRKNALSIKRHEMYAAFRIHHPEKEAKNESCRQESDTFSDAILN